MRLIGDAALFLFLFTLTLLARIFTAPLKAWQKSAFAVHAVHCEDCRKEFMEYKAKREREQQDGH